MATIMNLPEEIIANILSYNDISIEDIINFRCTCKQFEKAAKYAKYWEKKFSQRWLSAKKLCDKISKENEQKESEENEQKDNKSLNFIETGINCTRQLRNYVFQIILDHYYNFNASIDNFTSFKQIFYLDEHLNQVICRPENFINHSFFIDEIKTLLAQSSRRTGCDLTKRYCNTKFLHYLRQCLVREKWERFKEQPHREQLLERGATILAQWFQPQKDVFYSSVKASLDNIALEVLNCLKEKHPNHSIFSMSAENFAYWKNNNIDDNHWNEMEGMQIMDALEYIFDKLNFRVNHSRNTDLKYMSIDNVLENKFGQKIVLLIIYHSVARRLGLRCDVKRLPYCTRMCICWKPNFATSSSENVKCIYISSNTCFKTYPNCCKSQYFDRSFAITAKEILLEMLEVLVKLGWCNHTLMVMPHERAMRYIWSTNLKQLTLNVNEIEQSNVRPKEVKFAVGMIVEHDKKKFNQSAGSFAGVIIGWHRYIDMHKVKFSVNKLSDPVLPLKIYSNFCNTKRQTHYIILTENNEMCYVGEDAITKTSPKWIDNDEIGRYFYKFENTHYVPNKMLARFYPHDTDITAITHDD